MNFSKLWETVKDRKVLCAAVHGIAKCQTQLSNSLDAEFRPDTLHRLHLSLKMRIPVLTLAQGGLCFRSLVQKLSTWLWWALCDTVWRGTIRKTQVLISVDWTNKIWTRTGRRALWQCRWKSLPRGSQHPMTHSLTKEDRSTKKDATGFPLKSKIRQNRMCSQPPWKERRLGKALEYGFHSVPW